jgi:ubiquinone/menaquinone biosynthesis C-methylase UbiE
LEILRTNIGFDPTKIVADIGCGTGLFSKLFLENGNHVLGVEPNDEMRSFAERSLAKFPKFASVNATAEQTTLASETIDLVTVGQALHWFDREVARRELARILKTDGHACVVYNDRTKNDAFMKDYDEVIKKHARDRATVPEINDEYLSSFFRDAKYSRFLLANEQLLDFEGLLARMASASYMPSPTDEERFSSLRQDAGALFNSYEKTGKVRMLYDTVIFLGQIRKETKWSD